MNTQPQVESADRPDWIRALAHLPVRMWMCPVEEHAERRGVVTVDKIPGTIDLIRDKRRVIGAA